MLQYNANQAFIYNLQMQDLRCIQLYGIQYKKLCTDFRQLDNKLTSIYNRIKYINQAIQNGYEIGRKKHDNFILNFLGFEEDYYIPLNNEKINSYKEQLNHYSKEFDGLLPERNILKNKIENLLIENEYIICDKRF